MCQIPYKNNRSSTFIDDAILPSQELICYDVVIMALALIATLSSFGNIVFDTMVMFNLNETEFCNYTNLISKIGITFKSK